MRGRHNTGAAEFPTPLALLILRTTLAKLVLSFDVSFAPSEDASAFGEGVRMQFTTRPTPLRLRFCRREMEMGENWLGDDGDEMESVRM